MITLEHLRKEYSDTVPLRDVSVQINPGDVISIIGPSGTGKSTLIRCINMLDTPTSGKIIVDGQDITKPGTKIELVRRKMGMVFQSFNLFEHLTVIENLMLAPMDLLGKSKQEAYDKGMELLRMVGLASKSMNYPDELSGGQKQRVAIARTLAMEPEIILFDEPTSALDPTMVSEVQNVIRELAGKGLTMMIVTHEMRFAREVANRVFYMDQGGIYEDGTPEQIFDNPQRELTRRFVRHLKVCELQINKPDFDMPAAVAELDAYGMRHQISGSLMRKLHAVFEEMAVQILLGKPDVSQVHVAAEYSEENGEITVNLLYDGAAFRPEETDNTIAWKLISHYCRNLVWLQCTQGEFTNAVSIVIR